MLPEFSPSLPSRVSKVREDPGATCMDHSQYRSGFCVADSEAGGDGVGGVHMVGGV